MNSITPARISTPGIYQMNAEDYHRDCVVEPSLSNSTARILLDQSPLHAHYAHPRLTPEPAEPRESTAVMDFGSALHKLLLGAGADIEVIPFGDYRKDAAKERRDEARQFGRIPLLETVWQRVQAAAHVARTQMLAHPDCLDFFAPGTSEAVMVWQDGGTWCRAMVDRLPDDPTAPLYDVKTTGLSAAPGEWEQRMVRQYRTQPAFYARGAKALRGRMPPPMRFIVVEMQAPYAVSVMASAPSLDEIAQADVERAVALWRTCLRDDAWPGYPLHTAHIEAPNWLFNAAADQAIRNEMMETI